MQYRYDKKGTPLSALAFGCMRFTKKNGKIDVDKAEQEILCAMENGVNYFDTAYIYGGSEETLGKIFERNHCREQVYIADKLPHYLIKSRAGLEKTFEEQLRRLRTTYIDYYLMHMLSDVNTWKKLEDLGIREWIREKQASGQIRNIGFSFHGNTEAFCKLVDAFDWDFCMIQYNYLDEHTQAGRKGLCYASQQGLPVMIMEPLRGGRLVDLLPEKAKEKIRLHPTGRSAAEWAFRWLWDQPEVTCVLSGMNSVDMVRENCRIAKEAQPGHFTDADRAFIEEIKKEISQSMKVGCTGCGYCMPCPKHVDIPAAFSAYNLMYSENKSAARKGYLQCTAMRSVPSSASQCVGCGACEQHCPQGIEIRKELKRASKALETLPYKAARGIIQLLKLW